MVGMILENVSTHSRPKAAGGKDQSDAKYLMVSTHSRPKAAGLTATLFVPTLSEFQLTAARRRLDVIPQGAVLIVDVSTHSRPKAAGSEFNSIFSEGKSFNSQPPEGGWPNPNPDPNEKPDVSTHSRPKAAG